MWQTGPKQALSFRQRNGGEEGRRLHAFVFLLFFFSRAQSPDCPPSSADAQLRHSTPPNHSSRWGKPKDSGVNFRIAVQDSQLLPHHSHQSHFLGNPSAAKQCKKNKKKRDLKIYPVLFLCWVQCCIFLCFVKALVFKWRVSSKKGSTTKAKLFFCFRSAFLFKGKEPFLS